MSNQDDEIRAMHALAELVHNSDIPAKTLGKVMETYGKSLLDMAKAVETSGCKCGYCHKGEACPQALQIAS